jgi:hypothetical protein
MIPDRLESGEDEKEPVKYRGYRNESGRLVLCASYNA